MLQKLVHQFPVGRKFQLLINIQQFRQVFPSTSCNKLCPVYIRNDFIEILRAQFQITEQRREKSTLTGIFFPDCQIGFNIHPPDTVEGDDIKIAYRFVIFRRVSGGNNQPAFRKRLVAEGLALQKLQHRRSKRLRNAVDLIDEQNSLFFTRFDSFPDTGEDFTHGISGNASGFSTIDRFFNKRKSDRRLTGVVGDGIGHQTDTAFFGSLCDNLGFTDTRRPD